METTEPTSVGCGRIEAEGDPTMDGGRYSSSGSWSGTVLVQPESEVIVAKVASMMKSRRRAEATCAMLAE